MCSPLTLTCWCCLLLVGVGPLFSDAGPPVIILVEWRKHFYKNIVVFDVSLCDGEIVEMCLSYDRILIFWENDANRSLSEGYDSLVLLCTSRRLVIHQAHAQKARRIVYWLFGEWDKKWSKCSKFRILSLCTEINIRNNKPCTRTSSWNSWLSLDTRTI